MVTLIHTDQHKNHRMLHYRMSEDKVRMIKRHIYRTDFKAIEKRMLHLFTNAMLAGIGLDNAPTTGSAMHEALEELASDTYYQKWLVKNQDKIDEARNQRRKGQIKNFRVLYGMGPAEAREKFLTQKGADES